MTHPGRKVIEEGKRLAALALFAFTGALTTWWLASCSQESAVVTGPIDLEGVPTVRVRLAGPVRQASLRASGPAALSVDGRSIIQSHAGLGELAVTRQDGAWTFNNLRVPGQTAVLSTGGGGVVRHGMSPYRGSIRLEAVTDDAFLVINDVDMESYLAGVLSRELYPDWNLEAYRALAVAARTFALYHMKTSGQGEPYDLGTTQAYQVYGGAAAETPTSWQAVHSTRGRVLAYGPAGQERIFMAQYSACNGGYVNGAQVIRAAPDIPPLLGGQEDPHGRSCPRYAWPAVRLRKADIYAAVRARYPQVGRLSGLKRIRVAKETDYGRPVWLDLYDDAGHDVRLRAEDLRLAVLHANVPNASRLYSMNCRLRDVGDAVEFYDGRGFGHGVGLSQWGAQEKAQLGWTAEEILEFYYPGATVLRVY